MVFAGRATENILELQIVRLVVFAGPATDEILELQLVKLMVFAGPTTDKILELQIVRNVAFAGLPRKKIGRPDCKVCGRCWACPDDILKLQFVKLVVFVAPAGVKLWNSRL